MRILMVNVPYSGHVNPTLPLTRELVQQGHQVTYVNAEEFREKIEKTGAEFVPYPDFPVDIDAQKKKTTCFQAAYDTCMALEGPFDLLIYEMFFYPGIEIARKKGIPCVRQFSQPAWSEQMVQDADLAFRLSLRLIDVQVMGKKKAAYMGLEHGTMDDAVLHDRPDLNIVYVPEMFQKHRESFDDSFLFLAPPQKNQMGKSDIPYEKMKHPIVYISLGSIISNRGFCKECIRAFGGKEMSVILNTGRIKPETLGKIPENIYAYSFVPQIEVLEHTDVFLNEALYAGVPMVAMPFLNDQPANAKRVVELGLGKRVRSFPSRGKELFQAVCDVYRDEEVKENVQKVQESLRDQLSWDSIISRIEAMVEEKK